MGPLRSFTRSLIEKARRTSVTKFNRVCLCLVTLWLVITVPMGMKFYPTWPDFSQFYMGGVVARSGSWASLYPIPRFTSLDNPGMSGDSFEKFGWRALRDRHRVPNDTRFMLPPPSAFLFVPLTYFDLMPAYRLWIGLLSLSVIGIALIAGRLHRKIVGYPSRWEGALAVLIVLSPMTARAIRIGNTTPFIALSLGLTLLALLRRDESLASAKGALAVAIGVMLKYATLVLAPLMLAMRRWRMLFWLASFGVLSLIATYLVAGPEPFIEFYRVILPTLNRPSSYRGNQSLPGMIARMFGRPIPDQILIALSIARAGTLALIAYVLFTLKRSEWQMPVNIVAGAALLISWLLIFSPIAWEHWPIFLCPVWGWILWETRERGLLRWIALASLVLMYFPAGIIQVQGYLARPIVIPEPWNSWQLFGVGLLLYLAFCRLTQTHTAADHATQ